MVKLKFCGMTNLDDCLAAIDLGVDFVGFVFFRSSKRYVGRELVREITEKLDGRAKAVGVFVEETEEEVRETVDFCHLEFAQVYRPMSFPDRISVCRVRDRIPKVETGGLVLFDSYTDRIGGSGIRFDLGMIRGHHALERAFVAGGIGEETIPSVMELDPYGIDLVSSIEQYPGRKDRTKMKNLVKRVRSFEL